MSDVLWPIQFTILGTGEKMVMTVRSNIVRVSPRYRVRVLRLISTKSSDRTTMKRSVGLRGMTSTGTAMSAFGLSRNHATGVGGWGSGVDRRLPTLDSRYSIEILRSKLKSVSI